jgi:DNA-binding GntR family transcriptional regulator
VSQIPGDISPQSIARTSTAEEVADALRERILVGELAPGTRLPEIPLAAAFAVSRNTLRDAFRLLGREGLVDHKPHRGGFVAQLEEADVRDLYRIRRILEIAGVRALPTASDGARERLRRQLALLETAALAGIWRDSVDHDLAFHARIAGLLESARVDAFFATIAAQLRFGIAIMNVVDEKYALPGERIVEQHAHILAAIDAGDVSQAERLIDDHARESAERMVAILRDRPPARAATPAPARHPPRGGGRGRTTS